MITVIVAFKMSRFFDDLRGMKLPSSFFLLSIIERTNLDGSIVCNEQILNSLYYNWHFWCGYPYPCSPGSGGILMLL